jgi:hypothetical protein
MNILHQNIDEERTSCIKMSMKKEQFTPKNWRRKNILHQNVGKEISLQVLEMLMKKDICKSLKYRRRMIFSSHRNIDKEIYFQVIQMSKRKDIFKSSKHRRRKIFSSPQNNDKERRSYAETSTSKEYFKSPKCWRRKHFWCQKFDKGKK